jgi:hypothetical protein
MLKQIIHNSQGTKSSCSNLNTSIKQDIINLFLLVIITRVAKIHILLMQASLKIKSIKKILSNCINF